MRKLASLLSILFVLPIFAAETWRWKDADGVVHYSDRPVPGAERVTIVTAQKPGGATPSEPVAVPQNTPATVPTVIPYTTCLITSPTNDQVFNAVNSVSAAVELDPPLQPDHRFQVFLNGRAYTDWPEGITSYTLQNLYRGSYSLSMRVVDAGGRAVCTSPSITFHVRQPSLLAPARPQPRR